MPIAGWIGEALTLLGLAATLRQVARTQTTAQAARDASLDTQARIESVLTATDLSRVGAILEEARRLARKQSWSVVVDRFTEAIRLLQYARSTPEAIGDMDRRYLQSCITQIHGLSDEVEGWATGAETPKAADIQTLNRRASRIIQEIHIVVGNVRSTKKGAAQ